MLTPVIKSCKGTSSKDDSADVSLARQAQGKSDSPVSMCKKPGASRQVFVTPALEMGSGTGRSLAIGELMTSRLYEKPYLKTEINVERDPDRHPLNVSLCLPHTPA